MAGFSLCHNSNAYVSSANTAIEIKLVRDEKDLDEESLSFNPDFTHQLFGDKESIYGYIGLHVNLYYTAARMATYLSITYNEKVDPKKSPDGVEADDVEKIIGEKLQEGYLTNIDQFVSALSKDSSFVPYGELLHSFEVHDESDETSTFVIYHTDLSCPGFKDYHERIQTFVLWFIDAASFIDVDDDRWEFFVIYEKYLINGEPRYCFAGYTTIYRYYAYPTKIRPRISQMLILPLYQRRGLGAEVLQAVYNWYKLNPEVVDVTAEDPSENFVRLRDFVDTRNCLKLESFKPENLKKGFNQEMFLEAQRELKLSKKQARRVYEILRLKITNLADKDDYKAYRLDVKNRLNSPYQRRQQDLAKIEKTLTQDELKAALHSISKEQRLLYLENQFTALEAEYRKTLERIAFEKNSW